MDEHRCGPTNAQLADAIARGDRIGTWERCAACEARERALTGRLVFVDDPPSFSWEPPDG